MDINEIARLAGVSRATVSRYLNDGYVSQEKRKRISHVIAETGYVPSRQARQLRTGKTGLVGVIVPKINSQSVSRMFAGISKVLDKNGFQVLIANTDNDASAEVRYLRILTEHNHVDGIILIGTVITAEHLAIMDTLNVPLVVLGQSLAGHSCVYHDDYRAAFDVSRVALATSKVPAYIGVFDEDIAAGQMRHRGFLDACAAAGLSVADNAQLISDFTVDSGYFCCEQILDTVAHVDTIVCATDIIALGAMTCLREYGHTVPDEVQVTGIGDSTLSRAFSPSLTTVHLYYRTSGAEAAEMLLAAMAEGDAIPRELKMGYELYVRTSTRTLTAS